MFINDEVINELRTLRSAKATNSKGNVIYKKAFLLGCNEAKQYRDWETVPYGYELQIIVDISHMLVLLIGVLTEALISSQRIGWKQILLLMVICLPT